MNTLYIGMAIFIGIHLMPSVFPLRAMLIAKLGEGPYKGVYSLISLVGLVLIVYGKAYADFIPVWSPPSWARFIPWVLMLPALILIVGANVPCNIKRFSPHPMMWAVMMWAGAHLVANGDQASILLFAPFALFALIHIVTANMRGAVRQQEALPLVSDMKVIAMGTVTYFILAAAHPYLFKMPAFY
jgi:uncharacterized membrane protein